MAKFGKGMPAVVRAAINAIEVCRTPALGGHVLQCEACHVQDFAYHSCRHRSCPKCGKARNEQWFQQRKRELLPVPYFHVVFTVPEQLRLVIRKFQKDAYPLLLKAAGETILQFARDPQPKGFGGDPAVMTVLHTWTRTLMYHPHVHCLVPAVARAPDGTVQRVHRLRLAPQKALAKVFKAKLLQALSTKVPSLHLPGSVGRIKWHAHVDVAKQGTEVVLKYLARYVNRTALSDHRIIHVSNSHVTFKYRSKDRKEWKVMTLPGCEFLRRFLMHVCPSGFHKIRYFGLWAKSRRADLLRVKTELEPNSTASTSSAQPAEPPPEVVPDWLKCPHCKTGRCHIITRFERGEPVPAIRQYPGLPPPKPPPSRAKTR